MATTARESSIPTNSAMGSTKEKRQIRSLLQTRRQFPLVRTSEAGGHTPTSEEVEMAIKEETKPVSPTVQGPEQFDKSYYAEASLTKKIIVFTFATVLILIALGAIYAYWPHGTPR